MLFIANIIIFLYNLLISSVFSVFFNPNRSLGFLCVLNNDMKLYAMTMKFPHASVAQKLFVTKSSFRKRVV